MKRFRKVQYYTVEIERDGEREEDEFKKFMLVHGQTNDGQKLLALMKKLGDEVGAKEFYFRFEEEAVALPSKPRVLERNSLRPLITDDQLRLYCLRISDSIVILFNGGVKTTHKAQDCPNVRQHFKKANKLASIINKAIQDGIVQIVDCGMKLEVTDDIFYNS